MAFIIATGGQRDGWFRGCDGVFGIRSDCNHPSHDSSIVSPMDLMIAEQLPRHIQNIVGTGALRMGSHKRDSVVCGTTIDDASLNMPPCRPTQGHPTRLCLEPIRSTEAKWAHRQQTTVPGPYVADRTTCPLLAGLSRARTRGRHGCRLPAIPSQVGFGCRVSVPSFFETRLRQRGHQLVAAVQKVGLLCRGRDAHPVAIVSIPRHLELAPRAHTTNRENRCLRTLDYPPGRSSLCEAQAYMLLQAPDLPRH